MARTIGGDACSVVNSDPAKSRYQGAIYGTVNGALMTARILKLGHVARMIITRISKRFWRQQKFSRCASSRASWFTTL